MKITFESEYCIGDEVLYETVALKNGSFVNVFILGKIQSILISSPSQSGQFTIQYQLDDGKILDPKEVRGHIKHNSVTATY